MLIIVLVCNDQSPLLEATLVYELIVVGMHELLWLALVMIVNPFDCTS